MPLIGIRVDGDAGAEAGMGHVYRSIAYARRLMQELPDISVHFYMRDFPEGLAKVTGEGFAVSILPARPQRADFERVFAQNSSDLLIIDTLGSSRDLIETARKSVRAIITIDDLEPSAAEADAIVNGILWGTQLLRNPFGRAKVYQGIEYIQLREQFADANQRIRVCSPAVSKILISTGGADGRGFAPQLMGSLRRLSFESLVSLIAGPAYQNVAELKEAARSMPGSAKVTIVENATEMARYLLDADVALTTGGTVMFESAACGTPAVIVCSYEHQIPQAEWFSARGSAVNLGYFADQIDQRRISETIEALNQDRRQQMSEAGKAIVDARGLDRFVSIVQAILN